MKIMNNPYHLHQFSFTKYDSHHYKDFTVDGVTFPLEENEYIGENKVYIHDAMFSGLGMDDYLLSHIAELYETFIEKFNKENDSLIALLPVYNNYGSTFFCIEWDTHRGDKEEDKVRKLIKHLDNDGSYSLYKDDKTSEAKKYNALGMFFQVFQNDLDDDVKENIERIKEQYNYLVDPQNFPDWGFSVEVYIDEYLEETFSYIYREARAQAKDEEPEEPKTPEEQKKLFFESVSKKEIERKRQKKQEMYEKWRKQYV